MKKLLALSLCSLFACNVGSSTGSDDASGDIVAAARSAEGTYGVPAELTLAVAYAESRWQVPEAHEAHGETEEELHHHPVIIGIGGIRPWLDIDPLTALESEFDLSEQEIHVSAELGIKGTAAVLRWLADARGSVPSDILGWEEVLGDYAGLPDASTRHAYAAEIFGYMRQGVSAEASTGETVRLTAQAVPYLSDRADSAVPSGGEYPRSRWSPAASTNYASGRSGSTVRYIIIHTVQGSYAGAVSWFANPSAKVSAHYTVRSSDGEITQSVRESNTAYHAGNSAYNRASIGIEHEGYIENPSRWYTDALYESSAALVRHLCEKYNIPMDRQHIIGHHEVPDPTRPGYFGGAGGHTDPGNGWDWNRFMQLVRGGSTTTPSLPPIEVYWARNTDGSYKLHALAGSNVTRVEYYVDNYAIASATRADGNNFPATYTFSVDKNERLFEVRGFDQNNKQVALGVGLIDVTAGPGVFIRQLGEGYYDLGIERLPAEVASIEVRVDGFALTDELSGSTRSTTGKVRYRFGTVGTRQVAISTFNADGSLRGTLTRQFTFR